MNTGMKSQRNTVSTLSHIREDTGLQELHITEET